MEITKICPTCNKKGSFHCATCNNNDNIVSQTYCLKQPAYVKQEPYVVDDGIWVPYEEHVLVEAYNKWIKGDEI